MGPRIVDVEVTVLVVVFARIVFVVVVVGDTVSVLVTVCSGLRHIVSGMRWAAVRKSCKLLFRVVTESFNGLLY